MKRLLKVKKEMPSNKALPKGCIVLADAHPVVYSFTTHKSIKSTLGMCIL